MTAQTEAAVPSAVADHGGWAGLLGAVTDGRGLTTTEAAAAMTDILAGIATPAQIAGLIVGLRMKGETVDEMTGLASAMLDAAEALTVPDGAIDIVGTGGSVHRRTHALNISTMASVVAASAGAVVCKHGNRRASSTSGSFDFLEAIGVDIGLSSAQLERCVAEVGLGFAFARAFHPAMRFAGPVRAELGIPTVFNVLGPLAHPGRLKRQVVGTASEGLAAKMGAVLQNLGSERAWVVAGDGEIDELSTTGPSVVYEVGPEGVDRFVVEPERVGLATASLAALTGGSPADNARVFAAILDGTERGPRRDVVILNAAAGLVVAGVAPDLAGGVSLAASAVDDGRASSKLAEVVAATTRLTRG
jgi:anthranilate phosphoribosyltransferase